MMGNNSKINKRFGRLLVIKEAKYSLSQIRKKELWYWCACDCGKKSHLVSNSNLKKEGGTRSCGCLTFDGENKRKKNSDLIIGANVGDLKIIEDLRWEELPKNKKLKYKKTRGNFVKTKCISCNRKNYLSRTQIASLKCKVNDQSFKGCEWCSLTERSINYSNKIIGKWKVNNWRRVKNPRFLNTGKGAETIIEWHCKCTLCNSTERWLSAEILSHISTKKKINRGIIGCGCERYYLNNKFGSIVDQSCFDRFHNAKKRARDFSLDFDIDPTDCISPKYCPILGIKLERNNGKSFTENSPSLDRIDPVKGYVKGNVQVISMQANRMKNDGSIEELLLLSKWIKMQKDIHKRVDNVLEI